MLLEEAFIAALWTYCVCELHESFKLSITFALLVTIISLYAFICIMGIQRYNYRFKDLLKMDTYYYLFMLPLAFLWSLVSENSWNVWDSISPKLKYILVIIVVAVLFYNRKIVSAMGVDIPQV